VFYGCANYPECDFASWEKPVAEPCPECGGLMTEAGKNSIKCSECGTTREPLREEAASEEQTEAA